MYFQYLVSSLISTTLSQNPQPKPLIGNWYGFYKTIEEVTNSNAPIPKKTPLEFEFSFGAAAYNSNILEAVNHNLGELIDQHPRSTISCGSELRPLHQLEPLLRHHSNYERFAINHVEGIHCPLKKIYKVTLTPTLDGKIKRGNHKLDLSETERPHATKLMEQYVELGYGILLTLECIRNLKDAEVYPVGI